MKKKNQRKQSLSALLLLLLLTAILLVTSTYAWFTANQTVTISSLNVQVTATNGLQISADGTTWKAVLSNTDITGAKAGNYGDAANQIPTTDLMPVSTVGTIDTATGFMKMFTGDVQKSSGNYVLTSTQETETDGATGNFIAFDIFLKADQDTTVYLGRTNSNVIYTATKEDKGLQNAARVAFVNEGTKTTAEAADLSAVQGLKNATDTDVLIWEPNYDVHTGTAKTNGIQTYGMLDSAFAADTNNTTVKLAYKGVNSAIALGDNVLLTGTAADTHFSTVTTVGTTKAVEAANKQLYALTAGVTKIRVYMWVEGQDIDCENTASGAYLSYNLEITQLSV